MDKLSQRVASAFDVWDSQLPFLRYEGDQADDPVTRKELAVLGLATRAALVEIATSLAQLDPRVDDDPRAPFR